MGESNSTSSWVAALLLSYLSVLLGLARERAREMPEGFFSVAVADMRTATAHNLVQMTQHCQTSTKGYGLVETVEHFAQLYNDTGLPLG